VREEEERTDLGLGGWASGSQAVAWCGNLWTASMPPSFFLYITGEAKATPLFFLSSLIAGWMDVVRPSLAPLSLSRSPLELPVV
jgi:hypothetical protein